MIRKGAFSIVFISLFLYGASFSNTHSFKQEIEDPVFNKGIAYLTGKIGGKIVKKEIDDCPYERCGKPRNSVAHIDTSGKKRIFYIHIPDYKKGVAYLRLSMQKGNIKAARALFEFLSKRIDYKAAKPSRYLIKKMEKELGISFKEYMRLLKQSLIVAASQDCSLYGEVYFFDKKKAEFLKRKCTEEHF